MNIGYACIPKTIEAKTTRSFLLKNLNYENFFNATTENLKDLKKILIHNLKNDIYIFRISSDIIPFGSHKLNELEWWNIFKEELINIGMFIKNNKIRVSMHPGQYTVINSPSKETLENSIRDIEYHCKFLDSMNLDYTHKIVIHIGGVYGDKFSAIERFKQGFSLLSPSAKKRLVIENDDKSYTLKEVLTISEYLSIPVVFDNLHHKLNPSLNLDLYQILSLVKKTWKDCDGKMKVHYSDSSNTKKIGAHSEFVIIENFIEYYSIAKNFDADIMLEVKNKDISAIKCINATIRTDVNKIKYDEWAKYKYLVMEKSYKEYKECSKIINSNENIVQFYKKLDIILSMEYSEENMKNTLLHVWGYFKDRASSTEKDKFFSLFNSKEYVKSKKLLYRLSKKYKTEYLLSSYYFL